VTGMVFAQQQAALARTDYVPGRDQALFEYDPWPKVRDPSLIDRQDGPWQCSACSLANAFDCIGEKWRDIDERAVIARMNDPTLVPSAAAEYDPIPRITMANGLEAGNAAGLINVLNHPQGFGFGDRAFRFYAAADRHGFDAVRTWAGRVPIVMGGRHWGHWTCVLAVKGDDELYLANPAPTWQNVGDAMDVNEFVRWGPWWVVGIQP
jgi:hypothetical protein